MKHLLRRLSRVSPSTTPSYSLLRRPKSSSAVVPEGHIPVYVGDEMERFVVSAEFLNHPIFIELLNKSAQEYGYEQKGVLRIPCGVFVFKRVLEALRFGDQVRDLDEEVRRQVFDEFAL